MRATRALAIGLWAAAFSLACAAAARAAGEPLKLHPDNPRYFLFRGRPAVLITSGEHYGAVLNLDFDYVRYLDELKARGFNLTRTFSGTYREVPGSFGITGPVTPTDPAPLAPAPERFICPWARSAAPGASEGGAKFDLTRWDEAYFRRLKRFVAEAGRRGIVVELVLFCTMYDDALWAASPMNARNNSNGVGAVGRTEVYTGTNDLLPVQEAVTRKLVEELKDFDNVYFEVCNEPYERPGLTRRWTERIIDAIAAAEAALPAKHLIAENFAHGAVEAASLSPHVSVVNFHAATPADALANLGLKRAIAFDETGGADRSDRKYRTEGWQFILAGGAAYSHLDFSFTPGREDGTAVPLPPGTPGGGGPELRRQLGVLKELIHGLDFVRMAPDDAAIAEARIRPAGAPAGAGGLARPRVRALVERGKAYAIHVDGGTQAELVLDLPGGDYRAEWVSTRTGKVEKAETFRHAGGRRALASPAYEEDIALRVTRQPAAR